MGRIHWSKVWAIMANKDKHGKSIPFTMTYVKRSTGELKHYFNCRLSSIHTKGTTVNIKLDKEDLPQSFRKCLITKFNELDVYL